MKVNMIGKTEPVDLGEFDFSDIGFLRVNHLLIKNRNESWLDIKTAMFLPYSIQEAFELFKESKIGKYCYLTIDQGFVRKGNSLRKAGWHIDGFQGNEVKIRKPPDSILIYSNCTPTEFVKQNFKFDGFHKNKHNMFKWISRQVHTESVSTKPNHIYKMDSYCVHRAGISTKNIYRLFIRICLTEIPITSKKMTVNPFIKYDYNIHTTSGEIPKHLK